MGKVRAGLVATIVLSGILSGCHGVRTHQMRKMQWVNQTDTQQVMQFEIRDLTVMGRMHAAIFTTRVRGTYVQKKGDDVVSQGTLTQEPPGFILKSDDGKERRFELEKPGSIKEKDGTVWQLDNPVTLEVKLREW